MDLESMTIRYLSQTAGLRLRLNCVYEIVLMISEGAMVFSLELLSFVAAAGIIP